MKVGLISYPMLFQRIGGLQRQMRETMTSLRKIDVDARLINPYQEDLAEFELIHVFGIIHGNSAIIETAKLKNRPVLVSPILRPYWTRSFVSKARMLTRLVGRLSKWHIKTTMDYTEKSLNLADKIIALSEIESVSLYQNLAIPKEKITIVPNGISGDFFTSTGDKFCETYGIEPGFVLNVASISPHKNQLLLAQACQRTNDKLVLIGACSSKHLDYQSELSKYANVTLVGAIEDDKLLASAFSAASMLVLPSMDEVVPLAILESLAADRPAILTKYHCMEKIVDDNTVLGVDPKDLQHMTAMIQKLTKNPPAKGLCRQRVEGLSWDAVAEKLKTVYLQLI